MAKRLKNLIALLIVPVLMLAFIFAGCVGEYVPPTVGDNTNTTNPNDPEKPKPGDKDPNKDPDNPDDPDDPDNPDDPPEIPDDNFVVRLELVTKTAQRKDFTSSVHKDVVKMQAQWTDMDTKAQYFSYFDENGVATNDKLDGDYTVTLVFPNDSDMVDKYTYQVNSYSADNYFKDITIEVYELNSIGLRKGPMGSSVGNFYYYVLNQTGVYRTDLTKASDTVMFQFKAEKNGMYSIETLVDVNDNIVNPKITVYGGSSQYLNPIPLGSADGGGVENTYTKNAYWEYDITGDEVGNVLWFEISSTCLNANGYPLTVDFIVQRNGDFGQRYPASKPVPVTEDFTKTPPTPAGTFDYFAYRLGGANRVLNDSEVRLNPDDGYYYYSYEDPVTKEIVYTDRIYAKISRANEVSDEAFLGTYTSQMLYYVVGYDKKNPLNYYDFVSQYSAHCNSDGCYPVTQELKDFLQTWAVSQRLFRDGAGLAEIGNDETGFLGYNSNEESQWLYACGFYK